MEMTKLTEKRIYEYFQLLRDSMDIDARTQAIQEILDIDGETFVNFLSKQLKEEKDVEILAYMAEMAVKRGIEQRADLILPLLSSPDRLLRRHICGLLGNCGDKKAVDALIDRLRNDISADVRVVAAYALGKIGDPKAEADLRWAKDHDLAVDFQGWSVSDQSIKALDEIEQRSSRNKE